MDKNVVRKDGRLPPAREGSESELTGAVPRRGGLGRGLGALIPALGDSVSRMSGVPDDVEIGAIEPNPYQPRSTIDRGSLEELAASIRMHGLIQPLIVMNASVEGRYVLIAGERRWRAAELAGLSRVPVVVKNAAPRAQLEMALVENVVRADLSPLEEAAAYRQLIDEFGLTQATVAERVGRSRVSVTNTLRLLSAPEPVQIALKEGNISEGHARALLGLSTVVDQVGALGMVIGRRLSVRQSEDLVRRWGLGQAHDRHAGQPDSDKRRLEDRFRAALGTKVTIKRNPSGSGGTVSFHYFSEEELSALYERIVGEDDW
ncbi:MAG: ParB/RepB/Spo0J family partition protein [Chloroflexia bacterium]|nr:ParB/RepB/Spo0J family partition protein [Chloroflexia bacterium]